MNTKVLVRSLAAAGIFAVAGLGLARHDPSWLSLAEAAPAASATGATQSAVTGLALPNFTSLVQRYGPAVVNITVTQKTHRTNFTQQGQADPDDPFAPFFHGLPSPYNGQPKGERMVRGLGSGFIVSPDGYIMTNAHVVEGATEVNVKLTDRREFRAKVVGVDKRSDIAILKIDAGNLPVVSIGSAESLQAGEWVVAIGSPFGFDNTVTAGIVSAKARALPSDTYVPFIQTDVPVNPGNSGGPLFNLSGQVIGINSQIYSETGGYQGLSFAIPIDVAVKVKDELISHGKVTRGRIGVSIQDINQQLANSFGLPRPMGALIAEVDEDGPGKVAGLKSGDVVTKLDGREIENSTDLPARISELKPGTHAQLEVWRQGKPMNVTVTLGELSDGKQVASSATPSDHGRLGLAVRPLAPQEASQAGTKEGLVVESVSGPAESAGIQPGDIILALNGNSVHSPEQLRTLVSKSHNSVALLIARDGQKIFVPIDLS